MTFQRINDIIKLYKYNAKQGEYSVREYNYNAKWKELLTPKIVSMLSQIHELKGEQNLYIETKSDTLTQLV